jgi:hypothetical protein
VYTIYGFDFGRYRHIRHQELPTNYLKYNIYLAFFQTVVYFPLTLMLRQFSLSHIPPPINTPLLSGYNIRHALTPFGVNTPVIFSSLVNEERKKAALIWLCRKISCLAQGGVKADVIHMAQVEKKFFG